MTPAQQLDAAREELRRCRVRGLELAALLDDARWSARPERGGWSPAESMAHLNLTAIEMLQLMRAAVTEARAKDWRGDKPFRLSLMARGLRWFLEPPYRMKIATQPAFVPGSAAPKTEILAAWNQCHDGFDELIRESQGLDLDRAILISPFDPKRRVRYSVYAAFLILAAHERRHLWQISQGQV
jgi:hypothetical protein